jgi:thioredoxin reductase
MIGEVKMTEVSKEKLLEFWQGVIKNHGIKINYHERMEAITKTDKGFIVKTTKNTYETKAVLLAMGRRGTPRKLGAPGEDLPKVVYRLIDPEQYRNMHVLVVGGGDSALEAATTIAREPGTTVSISYRSDAFGRGKPKNREALNELESQGKLKVMLKSGVKKITPDTVTVDYQGQLADTFPERIRDHC